MIEIRNDDTLRFIWEELHAYEAEPNAKQETVIKLKKTIRNYLRKCWFERQNEKKVYTLDCDCYVEFVPVPIWAETYKTEWFDQTLRKKYVPSPYDCTGQHFTSSYHFVPFRGRTYCIHHVCVDM